MSNKYEVTMKEFEVRIDHKPATEQQLNDIEERLGYKLPSDYREFVQYYGNCLFYSDIVYPCVQDERSRIETIFVFYGASVRESDIAESYRRAVASDTDPEDYLGVRFIRSEYEEYVDGWPPELLPIGCDQGGNQICLAIFGLRPGAIFFWVNAPGNGDNVYLIADSFDEFMHLLRKSEM